MYFDQTEYDLKCGWGYEGWTALQQVTGVVVVVDVLSFSTAVDVAVSRGACVFPYATRTESAEQFAQQKDAILASRRGTPDAYTLSPASLRTIPAHTRLVLPSPNGGLLCSSIATVPTFAACLRNASAVAEQARQRNARVTVIAAGERWPDGSLRPCVEDFIGAGAVLSGIAGTRSPEAEMAIAAFDRFRRRFLDVLSHCDSGRELIKRGFADDVELASEYNVSQTAPLLVEDHFILDQG